MAGNGKLGIDHALVAVRDLDRAAGQWRRLGFTPTPRGGHAEWGTANHCLMFPADYVELIAPAGPGPVAEKIAGFLDRHGERLMSLAWGTADAEASFAALSKANLAPAPPRPLSRAVETPDGEAMARFSILDLTPDATPGIPGFVCQHLTPGLLRRPEWLQHPNTAIGIVSATLAIDEPERLMPAYDRVFGAGATTPTDNTVTVHTANGMLLLSAPDDLTQLHPDADFDEPPTPPALVALTIAVASTEAAAAHLKANGIAFSRDREGTLRIDADQANGVYLELTRAR